jgi:hypothetical protein
MLDRLTLSGKQVLGLAVMVAAGAAVTAFLLHFVARASEVFTIVVTCVSIPVTSLLAYLGFAMRADTGKHGYLVPLKAMAVLSLALAAVIALDFVLPKQTEPLRVEGKVKIGNRTELFFGPYRVTAAASAVKDIHDGDMVSVETTPLLDRVCSVRAKDGSRADYRRSAFDKGSLAFTGLVFFLPITMLRFKPDAASPVRNMRAYLTVVVPSFILSLIASGLWVKLFLVHVVGSIDKM